MSTPVKADDNSAAADKPAATPTLAEAYFFLNIIKYQKNKLDTDWDKVAEDSGFKNAETAKVRFGQMKKKLGFTSATPTAARVRPLKRAADSGGGAPAEKKPRKAPAKPRGKKQQAAASAGGPTSSPAGPEDDSPLAAKTAAKALKNIGPLPIGLDDGTSYAISATGNDGNGYLPTRPLASRTGNDFVPTGVQASKGNKVPGKGQKTVVKPELSDFDDDDDDDEEEENARTKAELAKTVEQENKHTVRHQLYDDHSLAHQFPPVTKFTPLDAQQVKATAKQAQTAPDRQGENAAAQKASAAASSTKATASTAPPRQAHGHAGAQQKQKQEVDDVVDLADVDEDMTLDDGAANYGSSSAFDNALYGIGDGDDASFGWI